MDSQLEENGSDNQMIKVFIEYRLIREFVSFQKQNLSHIYIIPSHESAFRWNGVMFIHHGLYADAILKFYVDIPENYPTSECPKIRFDPIPFHPLINPETGELNTAKEFPTWKPNINQIWHVILFARKIFYNLESEIAELNQKSTTSNDDSNQMLDPLLNPGDTINSTPTIDLGDHYRSAVDMYKHRFGEFQRRIDDTIKVCHAKLYDFEPNDDQDLHAIQFGPWDPKEHEILRNKLKRGIDITDELNQLSFDHSSSSASSRTQAPNRVRSSVGLSWVDKGSIFSKQIN